VGWRAAIALVAGAACGRIGFAPVVGLPEDAGEDGGAGEDAATPGCENGEPWCLDPSFGGGGAVVFDVGGVDNTSFGYRALVIQDDGKIVVVGRGGAPADHDLVAVRLLADGQLDPGFGDSGIATIDAGGTNEGAIAVALVPDGRVLVAGFSRGAPDRGVVARLTATGALDPTFGGTGVVSSSAGVLDALAFNGVAADALGRVVVAGQGRFSAGAFNLVAARFAVDGGLDPAFDGDGVAVFDVTGADEFGALAEIAPSGAIELVGQGYFGIARSFDGLIVRVTPSGGLDPAFAAGGVLAVDYGSTDRFFSFSRDGAGRLLAGGVARQLSGTNDDLVIARFTEAGAVDPAFGTGGAVKIDVGTYDVARALVVLGDGRIVGLGYRQEAGEQVSLIVLLGANGEILEVRELDVVPGLDGAQAAALDAQGRVVVLGNAGQDFYVLRLIIP
jgi:uncharacterized delta-60 repeat protein